MNISSFAPGRNRPQPIVLHRTTGVGLLVASALIVGVPASAAASVPVDAPMTTIAAPKSTAVSPSSTIAPLSSTAVDGQTVATKSQSAAEDGLTIAKEYLKQWRGGSDQPRLLLPKSNFNGPATRNYTLKGTILRKFLQWEDQLWGINLGWTDDAEPATAAQVRRWFFLGSGASSAPIRYGETIAIGNGDDRRSSITPNGRSASTSSGPGAQGTSGRSL